MANRRKPVTHDDDHPPVRYWTRTEIDAVYTVDYLDRLHQDCRRVALAHRFGWGVLDTTPPPTKDKT